MTSFIIWFLGAYVVNIFAFAFFLNVQRAKKEKEEILENIFGVLTWLFSWSAIAMFVKSGIVMAGL